MSENKTQQHEMTLTVIGLSKTGHVVVTDHLTTLTPKQLAFEQSLILGVERVLVLDDSPDAEYRLLFDSSCD